MSSGRTGSGPEMLAYSFRPNVRNAKGGHRQQSPLLFSLREPSLTKGGDDLVPPFNVARQEHPGPAVNPVGKHPVRGSGCFVSRRQVSSFNRRIFIRTNLSSKR